MKKVLLSAFACDPSKGSEPNNGWNWSIGLAKKGFEVHCLTRSVGRFEIEKRIIPKNLHFHYVELPFGMEDLYLSSQTKMYIYYMLWQWKAYKVSEKLHRELVFNLVHHVTWANLKMGTFLYKLKVRLILGPFGGGQIPPIAFKKYFGVYWKQEEKRILFNDLFLKGTSRG